MSINETALKELLGHLVFSHTFHTFDAKEAAEKALHDVVKEDSPETDKGESDQSPAE